MERRKLGRTDMMVAPLAFGGNVFGWTIDEPTSFRLLDIFTGEGFNLIDTADVYSRWGAGNTGGESETIIGNWLKARNNRTEVLIATKVGADMGDDKKGLKPAYIRQAVEDSLTRLKTDYIDLYQTHFDDETTPVEEILEVYAGLIKAGKVRAIGTSNMSIDRIKASLKASDTHGYPRYETLQPEYNLYNREGFEKELQPLCLEENISVLSYFSLASGFLTGKYRSAADYGKSLRGGSMDKYMNEHGLGILEALDTVAARHQTVPATIALAWIMAQPAIAAPIASATHAEQLQHLMQAARIRLDQHDTDLLNEASEY